MSNTLKLSVVTGLLVGIVGLPACGGGSKGGGGGSAPQSTKTLAATSSSTGTGTEDPCGLNLQANTDTESSTDTETATSSSTSTDDGSSGGVSGDEETSGPKVGGDGGCTPGGSNGGTTNGGSESGEGEEGGGTSTSTGTGTGTGGTTGGSWNVGPSLEGCEAQGKAWRAVVNKGPGQCGDQLVSWCCTEENMYAHFPGSAQVLKTDTKYGADGLKAEGYKLYHCSQNGNEVRFHWGIFKNNTMQYRTVVPGEAPASNVQEPASCTKVTSTDLGIPASYLGGGSTVTIPQPIGELTNTTKDGLKTFLNARTYRNWLKKDTAKKNTSAHGLIMRYMNGAVTPTIGTTTAGVSHAQGSVGVMEVYDSAGATNPSSIYVVGKAGPSAGPSAQANWFFYKVRDANPIADEPFVYQMGPVASDCSTCHAVGARPVAQGGSGDVDVILSTSVP